MNKTIFFIALLLLAYSTLYAQSLSEQMGGIKTHFQLTSMTTDLDVSDQMLILRAENVHQVDATFQAGWGYAYRSYHLEFMAKKELIIQYFHFKPGRDNASKLNLTFYDANKDTLASFPIPFEQVIIYSTTSDKGDLFFYSIDLINIPAILLDKTTAIDMVEMAAR